eukprot:CAMPEP_0119316768 /NCGR_PEP_ID=MMETSP1333-20130426/40797_1 /TAXON_ID=418940 /ORGANISM="Scyphosphaera apsteinii, Strain RCC1455" /LENGTH=344 /DNA_ID=CAMNT_0007322507 /DNA_START=142 /DNA_END=1176 /DNA_ORIENTATION=+
MKWGVDIAPWKLEYGLQSPPVVLPAGALERGCAEPFTVTDEQRRALVDDGAVIIPALLSSEWLEYLRAATDWQVQHPHFWSVAGVASGLYDYIQRSVWASNEAFANFVYYSPLASALAGVADAEKLRLSTDLLMVNPNKGFKWHQDNQNGPIDAFGDRKALRWWVTMDDTPTDHGAPVYLKGSHRNSVVSQDAVFVDLERDGLLAYPELLEFKPKAGDLIVWHARSIHKIDGPSDQDWGNSKRRVFGGTVALNDATYESMGRALFSDMGSHGLQDGDSLDHPLFPLIYPRPDPLEQSARSAGRCTRTTEGMTRLAGNIFASAGEMLSWTNVVNPDKEEQKAGGS